MKIDDDVVFQHRQWRFQRIAWFVWAAVVLAALAGLLGSGPLSHAAAENGPLKVEYERIARADSPVQLIVHLAAGAAPGDEIRVWIDRQFLSGIEIETISPDPDRVETAHGRLVYVFPCASPGTAAQIQIHYRPQRDFREPARVGMEGGAEVGFTQFCLP